MNFYKRHIGDISKACAHLSQGQMGAYDLLLDWLYGNEKPLPLANESLYRIARASNKTEKANTDAVIGEFFDRTDDGYVQKRASEEIAKANERADTNRRIAEQREAAKRARKEHESCSNREPSQTPDTRHQNKTTTQAAGHNPVAGNAFDETEGQGPTRDVAGDVAFWQPDLDQLRPRLVMAGVPIPEPPDIDRMLVGFRDYFTGKHHTQGQCYTKFVNWIQRERNEQTTTSIRFSAGTRPAPEQSPAVSAIELARDKALRQFDHEEID